MENEEFDTEREVAVSEQHAEPTTPEDDEDASPEDDAELEAADGEEGDGEGDGEGEGEGDPEYEEIEFNGKRYKVPAELKDNFLMHADYTRKRQADAERARYLDALQGQIHQRLNATEQETQIQREIARIEDRLAAYQQLNWNELDANDPLAANNARFEIVQAQRAADTLKMQLQQTQHQRLELEQQETVMRLQQTKQFAEKRLPGWSEEIDARITDFATETLGFTREQLIANYNPSVYQALFLAWKGYEGMQKAKGVKAPPKGANKPVRPLEKISGKSGPSARKNISEMSMDEYAAYRNQQEQRQRQRA